VTKHETTWTKGTSTKEDPELQEDYKTKKKEEGRVSCVLVGDGAGIPQGVRGGGARGRNGTQKANDGKKETKDLKSVGGPKLGAQGRHEPKKHGGKGGGA